MPSVKFYLVRHAPVKGKNNIVYGDEADIDLDSHKERLEELAHILPDLDHSCWYHSNVDRAFKTGKTILGEKCRTLNYLPHIGFREQNFGNLIGKLHSDITDHLTLVQGKIFTPEPPNGETIIKFIERVGNALIDTGRKAWADNEPNVVVFCHGGTIRAAHAYLNKLNINQFIQLDTPPLCLFEYEFAF